MKQTVDKLPPRLQRYKMRLMRFNLKDVQHVPGKYHYTADTLSKKIAHPNTATPTIAEDEIHTHIASIITSLPASDVKFAEIRRSQDEDEVCHQVKQHCTAQWPAKDHITNDETVLPSSRQVNRSPRTPDERSTTGHP